MRKQQQIILPFSLSEYGFEVVRSQTLPKKKQQQQQPMNGFRTLQINGF